MILKEAFPTTVAFCISPIMSEFEDSFINIYKDQSPLSSKVSSKRYNEFFSGRYCANQSLNEKNIYNFVVKSRKDRSPIWPENITGSISHSNSYALCALDNQENCFAFGIDIQEHSKLNTALDLKNLVLTSLEIKRFGQIYNERIFDLIFSAKESLFKALYPRCRIFFDHHDAEILNIDDEEKTISIKLKINLGTVWKQGEQFQIRFIEEPEHLITVLYLPNIHH